MSKQALRIEGDGGSPIAKTSENRSRDAPAAAAASRAPVHVVYGGANLFTAASAAKLGSIALATLEKFAPNFVAFADSMGSTASETLPQSPAGIAALEKKIRKDARKARAENYPAWLAWTIYNRTIEKLRREPVEDLRIDFEDGYGYRTDDEEDRDATRAAVELARAFSEKTITAFSGIRIKPYSAETRVRALRTLKIFLEELIKAAGELPDNFVVTLPKVTDKKEVAALCKDLKKIEKDADLSPRSIKIEIMAEHPLALIDKKGKVALRGLVEAAKGRCTSVHFGAFDYTAGLGIAGPYQNLNNDACNFARQLMLVSLSPAGVRLSDSVTTQLPVLIHKGEKLSVADAAENKRSILDGWRLHFANVTRSMQNGFYQSWDLHPNQLPARYAAVYAFFLGAADLQAQRLKAFIEKATQANLTGNVFDDAATAQGLVNFFRQAVGCGAMTEIEAEEETGLSASELRTGSFQQMIDARRNNIR